MAIWKIFFGRFWGNNLGMPLPWQVRTCNIQTIVPFLKVWGAVNLMSLWELLELILVWSYTNHFLWTSFVEIKVMKNLTLIINFFKSSSCTSHPFHWFWIVISSNVFLTLKIMNFEDLALTKKIHLYVVKNMNAYYIWYKI
jgi:hypothetical protein